MSDAFHWVWPTGIHPSHLLSSHVHCMKEYQHLYKFNLDNGTDNSNGNKNYHYLLMKTVSVILVNTLNIFLYDPQKLIPYDRDCHTLFFFFFFLTRKLSLEQQCVVQTQEQICLSNPNLLNSNVISPIFLLYIGERMCVCVCVCFHNPVTSC